MQNCKFWHNSLLFRGILFNFSPIFVHFGQCKVVKRLIISFYKLFHSGKAVNKSDLQPGDLIFWKTTSAEVGHVGMYVGNNQFIHAPNKSKPVKYDSLNNSYYKSRYVRSRRYY